ncbi:hypothetical protein QZM22_02245 [Burkholderia oklahomensis]|uniref:hypothetical protein n=1 Tax=Burkholderia oklahomensis TaxID=342113 RepID=UPI00265401BE|nr:hypothetical protein [Burkholderia oklahomensis]MDN7671369.1 hypothetical protein [Burkholderia oklahomensis]
MKTLNASLIAAILAMPSFVHAQDAPATAAPAAELQSQEQAPGALLNGDAGAAGTAGAGGAATFGGVSVGTIAAVGAGVVAAVAIGVAASSGGGSNGTTGTH